MKKLYAVLLIGLFSIVGCATPGRYNTQKGAAVGAGFGALTGQIIGRSTEATLIGTGVGTLLGGLFGNLEDQRADEARDAYYARRIEEQNAYPSSHDGYRREEPVYVPQQPEPPPGRWVKVPGHWVGNKWVPSHLEWRPVQPSYR